MNMDYPLTIPKTPAKIIKLKYPGNINCCDSHYGFKMDMHVIWMTDVKAHDDG